MDARIEEVMADKSNEVHGVPADATVREAVHVMNEHRIGSVLVFRGKTLVGIFTERDVLRRVVEKARDPESTRLQDVMTEEMVTAHPDERVGAVMRKITTTKHRHLPVMRGAHLLGLVSIGDLTAWVTRHLEEEVVDLHTYISGPAAHAQR